LEQAIGWFRNDRQAVVKASRTSADFAFAGAAGASAQRWSTRCRLCAAGQPDSQEHFTRCAASRAEWRNRTEAAVGHALRFAGLGHTQAEERLERARADLASHLLAGDAHYTRRCGMFRTSRILGIFTSRFPDGDLGLGPGKFVKRLRFELVRASSAEQNLGSSPSRRGLPSERGLTLSACL
jgi:hypothetical protein